MKLPGWINVKGIKEFFWPTFFLFAALGLALLSSVARRGGQLYAAAFLAVLALILAFVVSITLVPKLMSRVSLEFLNSLRFFRFTQRGGYFILIIFVLSFATFNTGNNLLILILSFLMASLIASGIIANLILWRLRISLNVPESIHAGQKAHFLVSLHNLKRRIPSFALRLKGDRDDKEDLGTDLFVQEQVFPYVKPGQKVQSSLYCEFYRRGVYEVDGFEIKTTFPFGFFWRGRNLDAQGHILVYPELLDLGPLLAQHPYLQGTREQNRKGWGKELYNIRDYASGESARFVHWKSTAKLERLMVKDFVQEDDTPLNIAFSTYLPDRSARSARQFEKAVSYIASLAYRYRGGGRKFGFNSGEFQTEVNGHRGAYESLMQYLARVEPAGEMLLRDARLGQPWILFSAGDSPAFEGVPRVNYLEL